MQTLIRGRWWALLLLLGSCRSEQAAFSFRPATAVAATTAATVTQPAAVSAFVPALVADSALPAPAAAAAASPISGHRSGQKRLAPISRQRRHLPIRRLAVRSSRSETTAAVQSQKLAGRDAWHVVLGAALVAAGVVGGLLLGGWLGLGVGALVVLLGYYFVVLGIGGEHAWLEVFQEFFNM